MTTISEKEIASKLYSGRTPEYLTSIPRKKTFNTGIPRIDHVFNFPCGYYVIIGNPGSGKSWFALWLARQAWLNSLVRTVFFSLEMPEVAVRDRLLQAWSDLTRENYHAKASTQAAQDMMADDIIVIDEFYADEAAKQTVTGFESWIDIYYRLGYRLFCFDHLHELSGANDNATNQQVTELWAKAFQNITKKYSDIWLVVFAQPNGAAAEKKILRRTDISGSKAITQKCDYVLSLNRVVETDDGSIFEAQKGQKNIVLFLDKTRHTAESHIGFKLVLSDTGNFHDRH